MRIEILIIVFIISFGIRFLHFKNKKKAKVIKVKMQDRIISNKEDFKG